MNLIRPEGPRVSLIERVHYQPNVEAPELEEHLGIPFEPYPAKIALNTWNKFVIWLYEPKLRESLQLTPKSVLGFLPLEYIGRYMEENHSIFYVPTSAKGGASTTTLLHENVHALSTTLVPGLRERFFDEFENIRSKAKLEQPFDILVDLAILMNKTRAYRFLHEGMADWGAYEVFMKRQRHIDSESLNEWHEFVISQATRYYEKNPSNAEDRLYYQGHLFIHNEVIALEADGLSRIEAFRFIMTNLVMYSTKLATDTLVGFRIL